MAYVCGGTVWLCYDNDANNSSIGNDDDGNMEWIFLLPCLAFLLLYVVLLFDKLHSFNRPFTTHMFF